MLNPTHGLLAKYFAHVDAMPKCLQRRSEGAAETMILTTFLTGGVEITPLVICAAKGKKVTACHSSALLPLSFLGQKKRCECWEAHHQGQWLHHSRAC